jgi:hypothetical protein
LSQAGPTTIISLLPGTYPSIEISRSGTKIVSQTKWAAQVAGSPGVHGIWTDANVENVTIDGLEVFGCSLDGINLKGANCVIRNCWVHGCAGSGLSSRLGAGTLLERNLVEGNGAGSTGGSGIALSGTNCIVRANVVRHNQGWGCQLYEAPPLSSAECAVYENIIYGNGAPLTIWSPSAQTNYVFNNTMLSSDNSSLIAHYGTLRLTNNILMAGSGSAVVSAANGAQILPDYNLVNAPESPAGPHDVVRTDPGFAHTSLGLYWLSATSPAQGMANPAEVPSVDFFGNAPPASTDIGAVQYTAALAADTRILDPSPGGGADYWGQVTATGGGTPLTIVAQPQNQAVNAGQSATFSVVATGNAPLTYQWTFNGFNVGSSGSSYSRNNCQLSDSGGIVRVVVSNGSGSVSSAAAALAVSSTQPNYYVSVTGSTSNSGLSTNSPWSLSYALSRAQASNVITLLPGTYPSISISKSGVTLRSLVKWGARIVGSAGMHGISTTGSGTVSNVVVDGFEVSHSYMDGVKFNGPGSTVRNCWIHHSGRGDPKAVINTTFAYSGQGVGAHNQYGTVIEYNLIENNGMTLSHDHGIYISGTNLVVRGNVLRHNLAYGLQAYDDVGECKDGSFYNNLIYGNSSGVTVWSRAGFANYLFNNTIISDTNYCVLSAYGRLVVSNNILAVTTGWFPTIAGENNSVIVTDYNLVNKQATAPYPSGAHDVIAGNLGFVNSKNGLYWLSSSSPARSMAYQGLPAPVDFFGRTGLPTRDPGAFQYSDMLATDTRILDPSGTKPDYWAAP